MTTTRITTVDLDLTGLAGDYTDLYDWPAITRAYAHALEAAADAEGVYVLANGDVLAEAEIADQARDLDWRELDETIDGYAILEAHTLGEA